MESIKTLLGTKLYDKLNLLLFANDYNLSKLKHIDFEPYGLTKSEQRKINALCEAEALYKGANFSHQIRQSRDAAKYSQPKIGRLEQENVLIIALNKGNRILQSKVLHIGGTAASVVCKKTVFSYLMQVPTCAAFIIAHNHPSGNLNPSQSDINMTNSLYEAGKILDIKLLDSIIVSHTDDYYSLADDGLIY